MNGRDTRGGALPLLPSGPGGVHVPTLSRPHPSTSTERERFELSIPFQIYTRSRRAPSAARPPLHLCCSGERRIRTYGTVAGTLDFESSAFDHSASSPKALFSCPLLLPQPTKKLGEDPSAFLSQHALGDRYPVVVPGILEEVVERPRGTRLRIACAKDEPLHPLLHHRPRAHRARLQRDEHADSAEPPRPQCARGLPERQQLSVRQRIPIRLAAVE